LPGKEAVVAYLVDHAQHAVQMFKVSCRNIAISLTTLPL